MSERRFRRTPGGQSWLGLHVVWCPKYRGRILGGRAGGRPARRGFGQVPDGSPVRMGWGVVQGMVALAAMTRSVEAVIGDPTNVAFRLAGLAGRQGRAAVMATSGVRRIAAAQFAWGEGEEVELKGRRGMETVFPVIGRETSGGKVVPIQPRICP